MCPPVTIRRPSARNVVPAQKRLVPRVISTNECDAGSQTCGWAFRLQVRTLPSRRSETWMGTSGQVWGGSQCPGPLSETGVPTVTVAVADRVGSAWLVARTWKTPNPGGAVYRPVPSTEPPAAPSRTDQSTAVSGDPLTCALNCC